VTDADRELLERADVVAERAYAPYSKFFVGAALRTRDGRIFEGVNVENAAYPLGICAEKTALGRAVSDGVRPGEIEALAVNASPCGGCRQWFQEFRIDRLIYRRANGDVAVMSPGELLPDTFELAP
jgi:cytidine deaminase